MSIGGCCQATSILVFNKIYQYVLKLLTDFENWQTETQYEDATIAKDFCFKIVNAYFACFFVAFVQNSMLVYGVDMHCPEWHCMPELAGTLAAVFILQLTIAQFMEVGLPIMKNRVRIFLKERAAKSHEVQSEEAENVMVMSQEEKQSKLDQYSGVFEEYQEMVIQFGYVTLFAAAFPLTAALSLMNNLVEIRTDAYKLLKGVQRPPTKVAADIGTWQVILDIISTCCILTNCALVGFTSHGLFFYFPEMTPVERVWITVICEHCLLVFKAILDSMLNDPPKEALEAYERRCYLRDQVLAECQYLQPEENDGPFYTDDEGEPFYGK
uniref:Anoctamin transmembrane domain-containing protein n=1 Tax=Guillardia theta (strain CCMP2712) TaxID=905079 RepID=A0A0C3TDD7_GUITC